MSRSGDRAVHGVRMSSTRRFAVHRACDSMGLSKRCNVQFSSCNRELAVLRAQIAGSASQAQPVIAVKPRSQDSSSLQLSSAHAVRPIRKHCTSRSSSQESAARWQLIAPCVRCRATPQWVPGRVNPSHPHSSPSSAVKGNRYTEAASVKNARQESMDGAGEVHA